MLKIEYMGFSIEFKDDLQAKRIWAGIATMIEAESVRGLLGVQNSPIAKSDSQNGLIPKKLKTYPLGSKLWTESEHNLLLQRNAELLAVGTSRKNREVMIGRELGRTKASVGIKLWLAEHGQVWKPKGKRGRKPNGNGNGQVTTAIPPAEPAEQPQTEQTAETQTGGGIN